MPLIEEISDGEAGASGISSSSTIGLFSTIKQLAARLALPEEFLSSYIHDDSCELVYLAELTPIALAATESYRVHALSTLEQIDPLIESPQWFDLEEQGEVLSSILRLYGHDPWTSKTIRETIDRELRCFWSISTHSSQESLRVSTNLPLRYISSSLFARYSPPLHIPC